MRAFITLAMLALVLAGCGATLDDPMGVKAMVERCATQDGEKGEAPSFGAIFATPFPFLICR